MLFAYSAMLNLLGWFEAIYNEPRFPFYGTLCLTYPGIVVQIVMLPLGRRIPAWIRIRLSIFVNLVVLALVPVLAPLGINIGYALLVVSGVATAVMESSLFGYFSMFPEDWNGAVVAGQGIAGLVASVIQVSTKAAIPGDKLTVTAVYCGIGASVLALCALAHFSLVRLPAVKELMASAAAAAADSKRLNDFGDSEAADADLLASVTGVDTESARLPAAALATSGSSSSSEGLPTPGGAFGEPASGAGGLASPEGASSSSSQWQRLHAVRQMTMRGAAAGGNSALGSPLPPPAPLSPITPGTAGRALLNPFNQAIEAAAIGTPGTPASAGAAAGPVDPSAMRTHEAGDVESWGARGASSALASPSAGLRTTARLSLRAARRETQAVDERLTCCSAAMSFGDDACPAATTWARDMCRVLSAVGLPAAVLCASFVATFLPFPGLLASVPYRGSIEGAIIGPFATDATWWFVALLFVYSVFDVAGRYAAGYHPPVPEWALACYALLRLGFTPLISGCAYAWGPRFDDALIVATVAGFAATNGHLATLCFRQGPAKAAPRDRELAGFVMAAALHVGIVAGSNLALVFTLQ